MKYELKDYHIGEVAKFYGLTVDAVRLYDKKGILSPPKNNETNYRIYSKEDFVTMDYVMRLRRMDIPLESIRDMMHGSDLQDMMEIVSRKKEELASKIAELQQKEKLMDDYCRKLADCVRGQGKMEIIMSPVFICQEVKGSMAEVMADFDMLDKESMPLLTIISKHEGQAEFVSFEETLAMNDRSSRQKASNYIVTMADTKGISKREDFPADRFHVIPQRKCLHLYGVVYTNRDYTQHASAIDYIEKNNLNIADWPLTRIVATEYETENSAEYLELWIPVK